MNTLLALPLGLFLIIFTANICVRIAMALAAHYRITPFLIGISLVAFGTSLPEIMVAIYANLHGMNDIAIGNAIGTNIANICLVLGSIAVFKPLRVSTLTLSFEYPLLLLVMFVIYFLMLDGYLGTIDSALLLVLLISMITCLVLRAKRSLHTSTYHIKTHRLKKMPWILCIITLMLCVLGLGWGTKILITAVAHCAEYLGMSSLVSGLTILAIGSSVPELITSIIAIKNGHDDLAVGNILGANIFNLLSVMIFPGLIHPSAIPHAVLWRDIPMMFAATLLLLFIHYKNKNTRQLQRWHGALLLLLYICYIISVIYKAGF